MGAFYTMSVRYYNSHTFFLRKVALPLLCCAGVILASSPTKSAMRSASIYYDDVDGGLTHLLVCYLRPKLPSRVRGSLLPQDLIIYGVVWSLLAGGCRCSRHTPSFT